METKKFEAGKKYWVKSVCDHNCIWEVEIISRTEKTAVIKIHGEQPVRRTISVHLSNIETMTPLGRFSMTPVLSAVNVIRSARE